MLPSWPTYLWLLYDLTLNVREHVGSIFNFAADFKGKSDKKAKDLMTSRFVRVELLLTLEIYDSEYFICNFNINLHCELICMSSKNQTPDELHWEFVYVG